MNWETGLLKVGRHVVQHGLVLIEEGADWADVKGTFRLPWFQDLALQQARGVHLDMVFEALFRGPALCFFCHVVRGNR